MNASDGIRVTLSELIEMRHRVREVQLFSTPSQRSPLIGLHHSKLRGRGVDFDQVRVYQAGDDVRTIDWRVTARTQEPHTKLFHEERERPIFIMVEQSCRLFFGSGQMFKSVLAAQAASLIGWAALGHNDRVGGLVFGDSEHYEIKPRRSKQSLLQLLNRLVRVNESLNTESRPEADALGMALRRGREVLRPGSLVIVICDERALTEGAEQQLSLLSRHCDLLLLPISDPLDHALPAAGLLRFAGFGLGFIGLAQVEIQRVQFQLCAALRETQQPGGGQGVVQRVGDRQQLELDTLNFDLRQAYKAQAEARVARWELLAQKLRILLMPLSTQSEMVEQLREYLNPQRPVKKQ